MGSPPMLPHKEVMDGPLVPVWVCTAALAILDRLDVVDVPTLGWWLAERQLPNGGLNGRPEKLEDVRTVPFSNFCISSLAYLAVALSYPYPYPPGLL